MKKSLIRTAALLLAFITGLAGFPISGVAFAAENEVTMESAMKTSPVIENSHIVFPACDGYTLSIYGSDNKQIVDLDGNVTFPLTDTVVNLIYSATDSEGNVTNGSENVSLTVPGLYTVTPTDNEKPDVLPSLREWKGNTGVFTLDSSSEIVCASEDFLPCASILKEYIQNVSGLNLNIVSSSDKTSGNLVLVCDENTNLGKEGYALNISGNTVVTASYPTGAVYAAATISQILSGSETRNTLPCGLARDYPAYEVRGLMLDIARTWFDLDTLTEFAKYMAYYKLNTLHLHLNEGKIRVENETQPSFTFDDEKFYTKAQYSEFTDTLSTFGIGIVNEIDSPAHAMGFTGILPKLDDHRLDIVDPDNRAQCEALIKQMYDEYLVGTQTSEAVSKNGVLHVGGDEYYWDKSKDVSDAYKTYMIDMFNHVISRGAEARMWTWVDQFNGQNMSELCGSFTDEELSRITDISKVTAYVWDNGTGNVNTVLNFGFNVINAEYRRLYIVPFSKIFPMQFIDQAMYFDTWDVTDFRDGYILPKGHPKNKGAIGSLWNDAGGNGATYADILYRAKGLALILSEKCWYGSKTPEQSTDNYLQRINTLGAASPIANPFSHVDSKTHTVCDIDFTSSVNDKTANSYNASLENGATLNADGLVLDGSSFASLPFGKIGFPWSASLDLKLDEASKGGVLFEGEVGRLYINSNGKVAYDRYNGANHDTFVYDYSIPVGEKVHLTFACEENIEGSTVEKCLKTYLVVNDSEVYEASDLSGFNNSKSFVLPVQNIGKGIVGSLEKLTVYDVDLLHSSVNDDQNVGGYTENLFADAYDCEKTSAVVTSGVAVDNETYYSGSGSYVVNNRPDFSEAFKKFFTIEQDINYVLTFRMKLENPSNNQFYIYRQSFGEGDYSGQLLLDDHTYVKAAETSDWQTISISFTPSAFSGSYPYTSSYGYVWVAPCGLNGNTTGKIWIDEVTLRKVPSVSPSLISASAEMTGEGGARLTAVFDSKYMTNDDCRLVLGGNDVPASDYTVSATPSIESDKTTLTAVYTGALTAGGQTLSLYAKDLWQREVSASASFVYTDYTKNELANVSSCSSLNGFMSAPKATLSENLGYSDNTSICITEAGNYSDVFQIVSDGFVENNTKYRLAFAMKNDEVCKNKGIQFYLRYWYHVPGVDGEQFTQVTGQAVGHEQNTSDWRMLNTDITPTLPEGAYNIKLGILFTPCGSGESAFSGNFDDISLRVLPDDSALNVKLDAVSYEDGVLYAAFSSGNPQRASIDVDGNAVTSAVSWNGKTAEMQILLSAGSHSATIYCTDLWERQYTFTKEFTVVSSVKIDYTKNLLENAFECEDINLLGGENKAIDTKIFHSGSGSFRTSGGTTINEAFVYGSVDKIPYNYSMWIKLDDPTDNTYAIYREYFGEDNTYYGAGYQVVYLQPTTDWQYVSVNFTDDMSAYDYARYKIYMRHTFDHISTTYVDEISVKPVPPVEMYPVGVEETKVMARKLTLKLDSAFVPTSIKVGEKTCAEKPELSFKDGKTTVVYRFLPFVQGENTVTVEGLDVWGRDVSIERKINYVDPSYNLIENVFECSSTDGFVGAGAELSVSTDEYVSGGSSLKSVISNSVISINKVHITDYKSGQKYRYSLWIKNTLPENNRFYLMREYWKKSDGSFYAQGASYIELQKTDEWQKLDVEFADTADDSDFGFVGMYLRCIDTTATTAFYIDEFSITQVPDPDEYAPDSLMNSGERMTHNDKIHIRFKSLASHEMRSMATEYGFIATIKQQLDAVPGAVPEDLKFDEPIRYVTGTSYSPSEKIDRKYDEDMNAVTFSAAVGGVFEDTVIYIRPYAKIGDVTVYGEVKALCYKDIAE